MSLVTQIQAMATAIGADIKSLLSKIGDTTSLTTTDKTSLVNAINEVKASASSGGTTINDASTTSTTQTWSAQKSTTAIAQVKTDILGGASAAFDTLQELQAALGGDANFATTTATALGNRVRYDSSQTLTAGQQLTACNNIGVGDPTTNFVTGYTAAKA